MSNDKNHHVAWNDRLGFNKIWHGLIQNCCDTYGTPDFIKAVKCLRASIINIKEGPNLRDMVTSYYDNDLEDYVNEGIKFWKDRNPYCRNNEVLISNTRSELEEQKYLMLYTFIIQLLENHNFGFYTSNVEEDSIE